MVFDQWPRNESINEVIVKVVVLNELYRTNIYDSWTVATHIVSLNIDDRLNAGDESLVRDIANVRLGGKQRTLLSFSTKYAGWHQPDLYQLFDSYVEYMLWRYQQSFAFSKFKRYELRDYPRFLRVVDDFRRFCGLTHVGRKDLDKFLWAEGRRLWVTKNTVDEPPLSEASA